MKPPECKIIFGAALYAALVPEILARHAAALREGADQTALNDAMHAAMVFADTESRTVVEAYVRPMNTKFRWHRGRR